MRDIVISWLNANEISCESAASYNNFSHLSPTLIRHLLKIRSKRLQISPSFAHCHITFPPSLLGPTSACGGSNVIVRPTGSNPPRSLFCRLNFMGSDRFNDRRRRKTTTLGDFGEKGQKFKK